MLKALTVIALVVTTACAKPSTQEEPASAAADAGAETAAAFIRSLLNDFTNDNAKPRPQEDVYEPTLIALMTRDQELAEGIGYLDGDPICDCQDTYQFAIDSVVAKADKSGRYRVEASFTNGGEKRRSVFIVATTAQGPRIYDIFFRGGNEGIRQGLTQSIAEQQKAHD